MSEENVLDFFDHSMDVITGEVHRWRDDDGNESACYLALAECLGHNIVFNYTYVDNESVNYINEIINGLPVFASNYLLNVMENNSNLLIYITRFKNEDSCYDIYYDFEEDDMSLDDVVNWMQLNNDFAAVNYRYTEIKNGKQSIPN